MSDPVELDIRSKSITLPEKKKKAVMRQLKREFGSDIEVSVDEQEEGVLYNFTLGVMTAVGTVVISNPQIVPQVIKYIYESDHITVGEIVSSGEGSFLEINTGNVTIDTTLINIERKVEINESTALIETASEEDTKKLKKLKEEAEREG
jgi:Tfp pilus assembly protein PilP